MWKTTKKIIEDNDIKLDWFFKVSLINDIVKVRLKQLECGPMPNVMVALPNIGGALCSTPQTLSDAH